MDVHDLSEEAKRGLHMYEESSDALGVDFRGRPCRQDKHGGTRAALFVLGILLYVYPRIDHSMLRMVGSVHVKRFWSHVILNWLVVCICAGLQAFEMMAIAAVGNNLITYVFNEMHFPLSKAANLVTNFIGTVFLLSLLGGFLSDSYLGSFRTMLVFGVIEISVCSLLI